MAGARIDPDDSSAEPTLKTVPPDAGADLRRRAQSRSRSPVAAIVLVLVAVGGAIGYHFWTQRPVPAPVAQAPAEPPQAKAAAPDAPAIKYPIDEAAAKAEPLPALQDSDPVIFGVLAGLFGADALDRIVQREGFVRRVVASVDNLPRSKVAQQVLPLKPAPGWMATVGAGDALAVGNENGARYAAYMRLVESTDPKKLAAVYLRFYPLFQQAYRDLGYPNGYFNDRLVETIDDLLAAPDVTVPVRLTQRKVLYEYADAALEQRSAGQKMMMRIGGNNEAIVKARLRQFRREIVGPNAKP